MRVLTLALAIAALVFGAVSEFETNGKSWPGWGVICLAALELVQILG